MRITARISLIILFVMYGFLAFSTKDDSMYLKIGFIVAFVVIWGIWMLYGLICAEIDGLKKFIEEKYKEKG